MFYSLDIHKLFIYQAVQFDPYIYRYNVQRFDTFITKCYLLTYAYVVVDCFLWPGESLSWEPAYT